MSASSKCKGEGKFKESLPNGCLAYQERLPKLNIESLELDVDSSNCVLRDSAILTIIF
jgi:hypothetical protein